MENSSQRKENFGWYRLDGLSIPGKRLMLTILSKNYEGERHSIKKGYRR
jgi:hypothetical protein